jgi:hypothetical protein
LKKRLPGQSGGMPPLRDDFSSKPDRISAARSGYGCAKSHE